MEQAKLQSPSYALRLKSGFELDVFVYRYIFDGILEVVSSAAGQRLERPIPSFSRRADAAKTLMIKIAMENLGGSFTITFGDFFDKAKTAGQAVGDNPSKMWEVLFGEHAGYGLTMEEAICKLSIVMAASEVK